MPAVFRKSCFHLSGRCTLTSCRSAKKNMPLIFKVAFPSFWVLHADVLSFCKVKHAMDLQKVAFPFFWALHASPSNHRPRPASYSCYCAPWPAAQGPACQPPTDLSPAMPVVHVTETQEYMNRVTNMLLQKVFPTFCASL